MSHPTGRHNLLSLHQRALTKFAQILHLENFEIGAGNISGHRKHAPQLDI